MKRNIICCLLFSPVFCQDQVKQFTDIPSAEDRARFASFPLVSSTVRQADWCEGVEEVEEVREVEGKLYTKQYLLDKTQTRHIVDSTGGPGG